MSLKRKDRTRSCVWHAVGSSQGVSLRLDELLPRSLQRKVLRTPSNHCKENNTNSSSIDGLGSIGFVGIQLDS
jgi:hypothetical protein